MVARNARKLGFGIAGLIMIATVSACGDTARAQAAEVTATIQPIQGLSCGWEANPCHLEAIVVHAEREG
jgi:hypothetical protein